MVKYNKASSYVAKPYRIRFVKKKVKKNRKKELRKFNSYVECQLQPKINNKDRLTVKEQVEYMEYKGIRFNLIDKVTAEKILSETNYYFKLSVSRKLFEKNHSNKYKFLDFKHLTDLSSIDMGVRYFLLQMSLDVEHSVKVIIIKELTEDSNVDPYRIVREFKNKNKDFFNRAIQRFGRTRYMQDMYSKHGQDIPYWVLLEILDMGGLQKFLKFYVESRYRTSELLKKTSDVIIYAKNIRNCTAHSSPFIFNMVDERERIPSNPRIVSYGNFMIINSREATYRKTNDLIALFFIHKSFCSDSLNVRRASEGKEIILRSDRMKEYYSSNNKLIKTKQIFSKLLAYLEN